MIDNVILLITGTLHQRSIAELVPKCHPLGSFEQMEAVNIAQTPAELYNAILVDTPLGEEEFAVSGALLFRRGMYLKRDPKLLGVLDMKGSSSGVLTHNMSHCLQFGNCRKSFWAL